jgi:hypothetical protein
MPRLRIRNRHCEFDLAGKPIRRIRPEHEYIRGYDSERNRKKVRRYRGYGALDSREFFS